MFRELFSVSGNSTNEPRACCRAGTTRSPITSTKDTRLATYCHYSVKRNGSGGRLGQNHATVLYTASPKEAAIFQDAPGRCCNPALHPAPRMLKKRQGLPPFPHCSSHPSEPTPPPVCGRAENPHIPNNRGLARRYSSTATLSHSISPPTRGI